jgi:protein ImuB
MSRPLKSIALLKPEPAAAPPPKSAARPRPSRAWLAVWLPRLPLDALSDAPREKPAAIVEPQRGQLCVVAVNARAAALGVRPGLRLTAALALAESLSVLERSPEAERAALESFAAWAHKLTPLVSIEPPDSVLLEVAGSRKLFGTFAAIKELVVRELDRRRLQHLSCLAPTALAALWLARAAREDVLTERELPSRLGALPVDVARWPDEVCRLLSESGVRTLGDCLRLPRDGFARRAGRATLRDLDLALGRDTDGRAAYEAPRFWRMRSDAFEETCDCAVLVSALGGMLDRLAETLRREQCQVRKMTIVFAHLRHAPTVEQFELLEPTHCKERLLALVADRLERLTLPMPAIALSLRAGPFQPLVLREPELFAKRGLRISSSELLERLRGRFGATAVYGIGAVAEHRPESAWAKLSAPGSARAAVPPRKQNRPLWMLPDALPLGSRAARQYYEGEVRLRAGPERIECGWWDGRDVGRDYYRAVSECGQELWVYRDRGGEWHLHGLFG